jgi:glycosyltransferase involved in cell wall biosynthesis
MKSGDTSGLPVYSEQFVKHMSDSFKLIVLNIVIDPKESDRTEITRDGYTVYVRDLFGGAFSPDLAALVGRIVRDQKPDIVVMQDYICEPYMEQFYGKQEFTKVFILHLCQRGLFHAFTKQPFFDVFMQQGMVDLSNKCWWEWKSIITSNLVITNSDFSKREVEKYYPEHRGEVVSIPLGVDVGELPFCPAIESKRWAYFGRLDAQKGINYLIRDFVENPDAYRDNPPLIAGDGTMDNQIVKADFFDHFVEYRGPLKQTDLWEMLKGVKYCVFPSIYEPYGLALNEALAMGKICLVHNVDSGHLEQMRHGEELNGLVFDCTKGIIGFLNNVESKLMAEDALAIAHNARKFAGRASDHFRTVRQTILRA